MKNAKMIEGMAYTYAYFYNETNKWQFEIKKAPIIASPEICGDLLLGRNTVKSFKTKIYKKMTKIIESHPVSAYKELKKFFMELYNEDKIYEFKIRKTKTYYDKRLSYPSYALFWIRIKGPYTLDQEILIRKDAIS
jgi:hypothetical protein